MFERDKMVTAYDVKYGKPNPEPYLMGLKKAGVAANEAIVIENAPIGVQAGVAAGVFTVAVNTGPLPNQVLIDAGANLLYPSMVALYKGWEELTERLTVNH
jgi:beta-phosphoglucomutase-like phosphatase (HAD superfamily)